MKTITSSSNFLVLSIFLILLPSAWGISSDLSHQQSSGDSLVTKSGSGAYSTQENPFKLLPPFYPQKDRAGFQMIPIYPEPPSATVVENLDLAPSLLAPKIVKAVEPIYPEYAKVLGLEGTVLVRIWVDERGNARRVEVLKSEPEVFSQAAIDAAMQFRFKPQNAVGVLKYEFRFHLPQSR